jgi:hypothetical protein
MDTKELKKLIKLMKTEWVLSIKTQNVEISLHPGSFINKTPPAELQTQEEPVDDMAALLWSAPGISEERN